MIELDKTGFCTHWSVPTLNAIVDAHSGFTKLLLTRCLEFYLESWLHNNAIKYIQFKAEINELLDAVIGRSIFNIVIRKLYID